MADFVEGLNGEEIITDLVEQIRKKLRTDCNLRLSDAYDQGYSAKVELHLKLYAMDTVPVDMVLEVTPKNDPPETTEEVVVTEVKIDETVEVPQELDLEAVRDRSAQPPEPVPAVPNGGEEPATPRARRKYTRRATLEHLPTGGAVDLDQQF